MKFISEVKEKIIMEKLEILYPSQAKTVYSELSEILISFFKDNYEALVKKTSVASKKEEKFTYRDIIFNSYANSIQDNENSPLKVLKSFSAKYLKNVINGIHILPFFPWDTDRGFSVLDYRKIDPRNGSWDDFSALGEVFEILMIDLVLNHASIDNPIVQKALIGNEDFKDFVIMFSEQDKPSEKDLLKVVRARPYPVLTKYYVYHTKDGNLRATFDKPLDNIIKTGYVWTTFSRPDREDGSVATRQVDLNYTNPKVFLEFLNIILFYINRGARWIRLDAVGYLWKEIGTSCLHLPQAHIFIQLLSEVLDIFSELQIVLISEVNEPQEKALQYLGSDEQESDMIYLFTHFPLAVHAVLTESSKYYMDWLPSLTHARGRLFISVLGTHDGMGMKPIGSWLPDSEKEKLQQILLSHGALPNYALLPGGKKIIYELCSTPWNFVNPSITDESLDTQIQRYLAVLALGLMLKGVPSIYINGLLGVSNNTEPLDENRTINRQVLDFNEITLELSNPHSKIFGVFNGVVKLIKIRNSEKAFDPHGSFRVIDGNNSIVSIMTYSSDGSDRVLALVNVTSEKQEFRLSQDLISEISDHQLFNLINGQITHLNGDQQNKYLPLSPYQILWLKLVDK
ncbi:MAG: alpha-amylase family glycosyl hydrolase [Candidatus Hodarchaeales archaeon]